MDHDDLRTAALRWLGVKPDDASGRDYQAAEVVVPAVIDFVNTLPALRTRQDNEGNLTWGRQERSGAVLLTARLIRRRNSPAGIEEFGTDGVVYVSRYDPDVARFLRLDKYAAPKVG